MSNYIKEYNESLGAFAVMLITKIDDVDIVAIGFTYRSPLLDKLSTEVLANRASNKLYSALNGYVNQYYHLDKNTTYFTVGDTHLGDNWPFFMVTNSTKDDVVNTILTTFEKLDFIDLRRFYLESIGR